MASGLADFVIKTLRGGLNNTDPAIALPDDQCTVAENVEFYLSQLGERRRGTLAVDVSGSADLSGSDRVTFLHCHLPTADETAAQLWALGVTGTSSSKLVYKDTSWHTVTVNDAANLAGFAQYQWKAQSLHGKCFIAYDSSVDRLHVWDGTSFRRTGLAEPAAPTGANTGSGSFSGVRYYRVRYTVQAAGVTLRRSEPSDPLTFTPSGSGTGVVVTKPASISEGETHWELEASEDDANYYVIATTVVGTTTVTDSTAYATGYDQSFLLSEDIGDYTLLPSAKFVVVDGDRLVLGGSHEDPAFGSRVIWTPVQNSPGVGNDERQEADTDPLIDLDGYNGGELTGLSLAVTGSMYAFKLSRIYKLVRSGLRLRAYDVIPVSTVRGALDGSVVSGVDELGHACLYFLDPAAGPCRIGSGGLQQCGRDIFTSWKRLNLDATKVVCSGLYDPNTLQVQWNIAVDGSNTPSLGLVLQTNEVRQTETGTHRGWALWTGNRVKALAMCLFADNIDAGVARSRNLRPFIGLEGLGLLHRCDTGNTDNGVAYTATVTTKPYALSTLLNKFGVMSGMLLAKAVAGAKINLTMTRDFGLETVTVSSILLDPTASETAVLKLLDNLSMSELRTVQFTFADTSPAGTRWELHQLAFRQRQEQGA